jgi:hypothetical protein
MSAGPTLKMNMEIKMPAFAGIFIWRSGRGLAYLRQAAESLASDSLRVPPEAAQAASSNPQDAMFASRTLKEE